MLVVCSSLFNVVVLCCVLVVVSCVLFVVACRLLLVGCFALLMFGACWLSCGVMIVVC